MKLRNLLLCICAFLLALLWAFSCHAQASATVTAEQDHDDMMRQLGITRLRPGPSGNEQAPDHANFDESKAGPIGPIPDALVLRDGTRVTSPEMWWKQRRPELVEDFSREIYGRVPANVPGVTWTVLYSEREFFAGHIVMARELRGPRRQRRRSGHHC
jgi:hypothetical protein